MKAIYLGSALEYLEWVTTYYETVFPQGKKNMRTQVYAIETLLGVEIVDEFDSVADLRAYALEQWKKRKKARTLGNKLP